MSEIYGINLNSINHQSINIDLEIENKNFNKKINNNIMDNLANVKKIAEIAEETHKIFLSKTAAALTGVGNTIDVTV